MRKSASSVEHVMEGPQESGTSVSTSRAAVRRALAATLSHAGYVGLLKEIALIARLHPSIHIVLTQTKVTFPSHSPNAFAMSIDATGSGFVVRIGSWKGERTTASAAVDLIERWLRGDIRLKTTSNGDLSAFCLEQRVRGDEWISLAASDRPSPVRSSQTRASHLGNTR